MFRKGRDNSQKLLIYDQKLATLKTVGKSTGGKSSDDKDADGNVTATNPSNLI